MLRRHIKCWPNTWKELYSTGGLGIMHRDDKRNLKSDPLSSEEEDSESKRREIGNYYVISFGKSTLFQT
jgi:hypothetical protein